MSPRHPRAAGSAPRSHRLTKLPKGKKIKASRTARSNTRAAEHRVLLQQQAENNENRRFVLIPLRQYANITLVPDIDQLNQLTAAHKFTTPMSAYAQYSSDPTLMADDLNLTVQQSSVKPPGPFSQFLLQNIGVGPNQEATFHDASNKVATGFLVIYKATTKNDHKATGGFLVFRNITNRSNR